MRNLLLIVSLIILVPFSLFAERTALSGRVTDNLGKPLEDAIVIIYHAGVKRGYSTFCPSCYRDCGKRSITDRTGSFTIKDLDSDLWFELVIVRDGFAPAFVERVDPSHGPGEALTLVPRARVDDPSRVVRGRVTDTRGRELRDAVVMSLGVVAVGRGSPITMIGQVNGLEPMAVTNTKGEFELAYREKATGMLLQVEARGMAAKLIALPTGAKRQTIVVSDGALIRGRLMNHGKAVAGAEVGLIAQDTGGFGANLKIVGNPYDEMHIGTQEDGSFVMANVPTPVDWYVYGKMEAISTLGGTDLVKCTARRDKEEVNVGDIEIIPGHRLRGEVTLRDGAPIADGMRVTIYAERTRDSQTALLGRDGHFEFVGLPVGKYNIVPSVRGYRIQSFETTIDRDVDGFKIALQPEERR